MNGLIQDLRFAARLWRRSPGFAALVVIVLAIGVGANSAIFSLADKVLVKPLPFAHPRELVMLWEHPPGDEHNSVSPLNFLDWSEQNQVFSFIAASSMDSRTLVTSSGPERVQGQSVSPSFFDVLGVAPLRGELFPAKTGQQKQRS